MSAPSKFTGVPRDAFCVALDTADLDRARFLSATLAPYVGWFKIGLTLFAAHGRRAIETVMGSGTKVFLDLKLHDIPEQAAGAVSAASQMGVELMTVHIGGGRAMLDAAMAARKGTAKIVGVTVLTSFSDESWGLVHPGDTPLVAVGRFTDIAMAAGLDGIVLSPREVAETRARVPGDFMLVVPGIRPISAAVDDQARIGTPEDVIADGGDLLVIGRPVTRASDPVAAARAILGTTQD